MGSTGDELLAINGESPEGLTHSQAIASFKHVREGALVLDVVRKLTSSSLSLSFSSHLRRKVLWLFLDESDSVDRVFWRALMLDICDAGRECPVTTRTRSTGLNEE